MSIAPGPDRTAVVTGASAGIGAGLARDLARRGFHVTLVARREGRLEDLATEIAGLGGSADLVAADLTAADDRARVLAAVADGGRRVGILANNAGVGVDGPFHERPIDAQSAMLDLNVGALTELTHAVVADMVRHGSGAVLNVASTAAFQPMPRMAAYAASKSYVLAFSHALRRELRGTGVGVTALCPGPTRTEFLGERQATFEGQLPGFVFQSADACARAGVAGLLRGRRTVVPGAMNKAGAILGRHSPTATTAFLDHTWPLGR